MLVAAAAYAAVDAWVLDRCPRELTRFAYDAPSDDLLRGSKVLVLDDGREVDVAGDDLSMDPSLSPDGSEVVFASGRDGDFAADAGYERLALFVADADGTDVRRLTSGPYDYAPDWSPDGSEVAFVRYYFGAYTGDEEREVWTVDVETRRERRVVVDDHRRDVTMVRWSPDGARLAYVRAARGEIDNLWIVDADGSGGRLVRVHASTVTWSPDGERIAYAGTHQGTEGVFVIDADGDPEPRLLDTKATTPVWSADGDRIAYLDHVERLRWALTLRPSGGGRKTRIAGAPPFVFDQTLDWATCA